MYKKIALFVLFLSIAQAPVVKVRGAITGDVLTEFNLDTKKIVIGTDGTYSKELFEAEVKRHLIEENHGYDDRLSKLVLPETLVDTAENNVGYLKNQLYYLVEPSRRGPGHNKIIHFPQLDLQLTLRNSAALQEGRYDDFSELQNYEIASFNHAHVLALEKREYRDDLSTWVVCPGGVSLNLKTLNFLDKIRGAFGDHGNPVPGEVRRLLERAMKLVGIPYETGTDEAWLERKQLENIVAGIPYDHHTTLKVDSYNRDVALMRRYLVEVGLLPTSPSK